MLSLFFFLFLGSINAQEKISEEVLKEIQTSYLKDPYTKAARNALINNEISDLAKNWDQTGKLDHYFDYRVEIEGSRTDQKSSGRCWMFTSMNVMRPKVMEQLNTDDFEFSENYLYFWDLFEKSNLFLENVIETADKSFENRYVDHYFSSPVGDGGVWNSYINLAKKYGLVPKAEMPETHSSSNTRWLRRLLNRKLREFGLELRELVIARKDNNVIQERKVEMLKDVYRMLALNLGEPPTEFQWRYKDKEGNLSDYKTYTPRSFMQEVLPEVKLDDYVMLMNDPSRPYYKYYEIENYRNVEEGVNWKYINLPNDDLKRFAIRSIKANEAMYASCDVGKQLDNERGFAAMENYDFESLYGVDFHMSKRDRILSGESGSTHGMALIAVDLDDKGRPVKWQFENSWGPESGHQGFLTFGDDWFDNYIFRLVIHKQFIDQNILDILQEEPILLPPWDPMS